MKQAFARHRAAMLLMSQRNVGTYRTQPVGNQQTLEAVGMGLNTYFHIPHVM
jgi:hypothetical protein